MPDYVAPSATTAGKVQGGSHTRQFVNDTIGSTGLVTAPAAGTTVTFVVVPISGTYSVQLTYGYAGPPSPNQTNNFRVQVQAIAITSLAMLPVNSTVLTATVILTVGAGQSIGLNAIVADTGQMVGSIYATQMG
jgi:hypothetical protein